MPTIPLPLSREDCFTYEEWRAYTLMWKIMNNKPNQKIGNPHYKKPFEVIPKYKYPTNAQIESHIHLF
jgi:hypothetical protein